MARKRYKSEETVAKLRQVDVLTSQGQSMADAIRPAWSDDEGRLTADIIEQAQRDSTHYLERDELWGCADYVALDHPRNPLPLEGLAGTQAGIGFGVQVHMLRHACGYALALDTPRLQHYLGHASITKTVRYSVGSPEPFRDIWR